MKIAVTSKGTTLNDAVESRFGRAHYFAIVDVETNEATFIDNAQNLEAGQGAGIQSAQKVSDAGAESVITGNVGPKAFAALKAAGIRICLGAEGTVAEALERFRNGRLEEADHANVESHWA